MESQTDEQAGNASGECTCDSITYNSEDAPLNTEIMSFFTIMKGAVTHCAMAGGAVLAEIIYQARKCSWCCSQSRLQIQELRTNNDVDLFVHRYPKLLEKFYSPASQTAEWFYCGTHLQNNERFTRRQQTALFKSLLSEEKQFDYLLSEQIIPEFNQLMGHRKAGKIQIQESLYIGGEEYYQINGIYKIFDLKFEESNKRIQVIVLDRLPEDKEQSWSSFAVSKFDIDIVKNQVSTTSMTGKRKSMTRLSMSKKNLFPQVSFENEHSRQSFENGVFVYTVLPGAEFETMFGRIQKYLKRGFKLKELKFDPRLTPFWKKYHMGRFNALFAKQWACDVLKSAIDRRRMQEITNEEQEEMEETEDQFKSFVGVASLLAQYQWAPPTILQYLDMKTHQRALEKTRQHHR